MRYVSYLNYGCIEIFENLLASADRQGITKDSFLIGCLDRKTEERLQELGYENAIFWESEASELTDYQTHSFREDSAFRIISNQKWPIVKHFFDLYKDETICFIDADSVILSDTKFDELPKEYCYLQHMYATPDNIERYLDYNSESACGGLQVFNDTPFARELIDTLAKSKEDDQISLNTFCMQYEDTSSIKLLASNFYATSFSYLPRARRFQAENLSIYHPCGIKKMRDKINRLKQLRMWFLDRRFFNAR